MKYRFFKITLVASLFALFLQTEAFSQEEEKRSWNDIFKSELPYLGHRNWILVVDAAYPLQSSPAIKTIIADEKIESVASTVLKMVEKADHVKPIVYQDKEFSYMKDSWSKGCEALKAKMSDILAPYNPNVILHDEIFSKLDSASKLFNVIVIKSNCTIPYSSIFIELDCGYWDSKSENTLRQAIGK